MVEQLPAVLGVSCHNGGRKEQQQEKEDILRVVNADNIDCFLKDFGGWLAFTIGIDALQEALDGGVGIRQESRGTMHWIDDGKNDAHIRVSTGTDQ